jgi:hypothetical protein
MFDICLPKQTSVSTSKTEITPGLAAGTYATAEDIAAYFGEDVEGAGAGDEAISAGEAIFNHWNRQFGVEGPQVSSLPACPSSRQF